MNEAGGRLMSVKADLVREHLVGQVYAEVMERYPGEIPEPLAVEMRRALERVGGPEQGVTAPPETIEIAGDLARIGYLSRVAEAEMFEPAREAPSWLADMLRERRSDEGASWQEAAVAVSRELALAEPDERPDPGGEHPSWRVAGPGGHVRHYVALEAAAERCPKDAEANPRLPERIYKAGDLKRCWMFGFFLRCCEEALPPNASGQP